MAEELVPRVEIIENPREVLEYLKKSGCTIRLFLKEGDKDRHETNFPLNEHRMLRVYAENHYDTLSSTGGQMIPKSRKDKGLSAIFVGVAPVYENQKLTFFLPLKYLTGKSIKEEVPIFSFGFEESSGNLTIRGNIHYNIYTSRQNLGDNLKRDFDKKGKDFNLNDFGWDY